MACCQVVLVVKSLPASAGDVRDAGLIPGSGRSPLEEKMTTHSSILAWRTEEPCRLQSMDCKESDMTEVTESMECYQNCL